MKYKLPLKINNGHGEVVTFTKEDSEPDGGKLFFETIWQPNSGPVEHIHLKQDEYFEVVKGQMSYQLGDKSSGNLTAGQNVLLPMGVSHKPRNNGTEELVIRGWVQPANNFVFFLSTLFESMKNQNKPQPSPFDGAFLVMLYASEYKLTEIPFFVRKVIIPLTYLVGKLTGKYKKYENAPKPI
ncbi:MAG: cupin domain-containing protein [Bacteroidota bacterium]